MSPFAYLIPYANHHAFESAMGPMVYDEALGDFLTAIPASLGQSEKDLLVDNWKSAWARFRTQSGRPAIEYP